MDREKLLETLRKAFGHANGEDYIAAVADKIIADNNPDDPQNSEDLSNAGTD